MNNPKEPNSIKNWMIRDQQVDEKLWDQPSIFSASSTQIHLPLHLSLHPTYLIPPVITKKDNQKEGGIDKKSIYSGLERFKKLVS